MSKEQMYSREEMGYASDYMPQFCMYCKHFCTDHKRYIRSKIIKKYCKRGGFSVKIKGTCDYHDWENGNHESKEY